MIGSKPSLAHFILRSKAFMVLIAELLNRISRRIISLSSYSVILNVSICMLDLSCLSTLVNLATPGESCQYLCTVIRICKVNSLDRLILKLSAQSGQSSSTVSVQSFHSMCSPKESFDICSVWSCHSGHFSTSFQSRAISCQSRAFSPALSIQRSQCRTACPNPPVQG
jgi:hypothetical protein